MTTDAAPGTGVTVGITGARGYVGRLLEERLRSRGCTTVPLGRGAAHGTPGWRPFDLGEPVPDAVLAGIDVLVHCAWDLKARDRTTVWRTNVDGTGRLLAAARRAGVARIVFVSSMSAYEGTTQLYGLSKLACEEAVNSAGGTVARLGLVYGPGGGGMAGALAKLTRLPVTPLVCPQARQFTVHEDDMSDALCALALWSKSPTLPVGVAHPLAVPFRALLEGIADDDRRPRFVRVPSWVVYGALRSLELLGVDAGFRSDSLLGLMRPAEDVPGADVLRELGVRLRPFSVTATDEGSR